MDSEEITFSGAKRRFSNSVQLRPAKWQGSGQRFNVCPVHNLLNDVTNRPQAENIQPPNTTSTDNAYIGQLQIRVSNQQSQITSQQRDITDLRGQIRNQNARIATLERRLEAQRQAHEAQRQAHELEMQRLRDQHQLEIQDLRAQVNSLLAQLNVSN